MWRWGRFRVTQKKNEKALQWKMERQKKKKGKQSKGNENARENNLVTKKSANPRIKQMSKKKAGKGQSAYKNSTNTNKNNKKYCVPVTSRAMQEVQTSSFQLDNIASFAALPHFFIPLFSLGVLSLSLSLSRSICINIICIFLLPATLTGQGGF